MGLESATYISDLVSTNPVSSDAKSQGDDHIRLVKATVKATFPNVSGAVTPTHTELNYVDGVTSAIQTQIDAKGAHAGQTWTGTHDFSGGTLYAATQTLGDSSTKAASTAFVAATAFSSALPAQTGNSGKFVTTDGTNASWATAATPSAPQSWEAQQTFSEVKETVYTITDGAAFEVDPVNGSIQIITLGASRTPKATNFEAGQSVTLMVNDGTAYTLTWTDATWGTSGVVWVGGVAPALATTGYSVIEFWKVGSQVYGAYVGDVA